MGNRLHFGNYKRKVILRPIQAAALAVLTAILISGPATAASPAVVSASVTLNPLEIAIDTAATIPANTVLTIKAIVCNRGEAPLEQPAAAIILPSGWVALSGKTVKPLTEIAPHGSATAAWQILAASSGHYSIRVSASGIYTSIPVSEERTAAVNIIANTSGSQIWKLNSRLNTVPPQDAALADSSAVSPICYEMEKSGGPQDYGQYGSVDITPGVPAVWLSDQKAEELVTFSGDWILKLETAGWNGTLSAQVGEWDGTAFHAFNPAAAGSPENGLIAFSIETVGALPPGHRLAVNITGDESGTILTAGNSYLISPGDDPGFPVPEFSTSFLLASGITGLVIYILAGRRKKPACFAKHHRLQAGPFSGDLHD